MNKAFVLFLLLLLTAEVALADSFAVTSPQLQEGGFGGDEQVFNGFGCEGKNISPALQWEGAPPGTRSYAITVYDPDAPTGSGWWHWVIFNIPANVTSLEKGAGDPLAGYTPPGSVQSRTDFGAPGYGGPCPPAGDKPHRYRFTVHALKTDKLPLDENAPAAMVGFYLYQSLIEKAALEVEYGR